MGALATRPEIDVVAANRQAVLGVSRVESELRGRLGDAFEHKGARETNTLAAGRHLGAGGFQNPREIPIEEIHADFFQHLERRIVNGLDLVGTQNLDRFVRNLIMPPRRLLDAASSPPLAPTFLCPVPFFLPPEVPRRSSRLLYSLRALP